MCVWAQGRQLEAEASLTAACGTYHPQGASAFADAMTAKDTKLRLEWKTGVAATDWEDVAKKENLDQMATELRKLEDTVKEIHNEMMYLRKREEQMRNLNGTPLIRCRTCLQARRALLRTSVEQR